MAGIRTGKLTKAERVKQIRPLSLFERDQFLAAASPAGPYAACFATMAKAGLRPGEAYALKPDDLDLEGRTILVERTLDRDGSIRTTKTGETRTVRLMASLVRSLRRHLVWLKGETLKRGWGSPAWLFPTEANTALDPTKVAKVFKAVLRRTKLPVHHRPYDLRHTYATLMLAGGAPITFVSHQLGHSSSATTLRFYARWIPGEGAQWVDILEPDSGTRAVGEAVSVGAGGES